MMVDISNLTSGFIGAVIGALLGFLGLVGIQWWQDRKDDRAAVRTTLMEVTYNISNLRSSQESGVYLPLLTGAWGGTRLRLARHLTGDELLAVTLFYSHVEAILSTGFSLNAGEDEDVRKLSKFAEKFIGDAFTALRKRAGWSEDEWERLRARAKAKDAGRP
jgi:hypothetical protein